MSYLDGTVKMWDYSTPIKERHSGPCGPYMFTRQPTRTGRCEGFGGYLGHGEINDGSMVRLRIALAGDVVRLEHTGWYCDQFQDQTMCGIVARLPRSRGFLAGWTMGVGMCCSFDGRVHETIEEAARAADEEARIGAEREREHQEEQDAEIRAVEALTDLRGDNV